MSRTVGGTRRAGTAAPLSDGRLEVFATASDHNLYSRWQLGTDPDAVWSDWIQSPLPANTPVFSCAVGQLSNKSLQLWVVDIYHHLWTCWKLTPDPNAGWSVWYRFPDPPNLYLDAGQLGLLASGMQLSVRSFKVIAL